MTQRHFLPDFLLIPYQLIADDRIEPLDEKVYAVIYWLEHLKGGDCNPSNEEIAQVVHASTESGVRSIQNSLTRLESLGYISRDYNDPETRRHRTAIHTMIAFRNLTSAPPLKATKVKKVKQTALALEHQETPREFAARFFGNDRDALAEIGAALLEATGMSRENLYHELKKFITYWTEPNGSGTKARWQLHKTFEVRRRLATWLSNKKGKSRKGAVV